MKEQIRRPKGGGTPSGLTNKLTTNDSITLRLLFYNSDGNLFAEANLIFNSICDLSTQQIFLGKYIKHFSELYHITEDQMEVCIHV